MAFGDRMSLMVEDFKRDRWKWQFDARTLWSLGHTYALVKGRASSENGFTPLVFLSFTPFLASHLPSSTQLSSCLSFHQVIINQS